MSTRVQEMIRRYESFETSTLSYDAPEDELSCIKKLKELKKLETEQKTQQENKKHSSSHSKRVYPSPPQVESRSPPPDMEIVTDSSSTHPDFETWKREMTRTLMTGSLQTLMYGQDSTEIPKPLKNNYDWKSTRLNRRRLEKKWIHNQLRSVKSDVSNNSESETNEEDQSSVNAFIDVDNIQAERTKEDPNPPDSPPRREQPDATMQREAPESPALRESLSMVEATLSPKAKPLDSTELAEVMVELSNLKNWHEGNSDSMHSRKSESLHSSIHLRKSESMHSSILSSIHSRILDSMHSRKSKESTAPDKKNSEHSEESAEIPVSICVPDLKSDTVEASAQVPPSIVVPDLKSTDEKSEKAPKSLDVPQTPEDTTEMTPEVTPEEPENENKENSEQRNDGSDKTIPTFLKVDPAEVSEEEPENKYRAMLQKRDKTKGTKKRVRFCKGFVTETFYRPWTKEEDIDELYFQEEELMIWEKDEKTTLRDRFEVEFSVGTPVISYHNSFSYDAHDVTEEEVSA